MKILIAKVHGTEIDRKTVSEASPLQMHQFMFEVKRGVTKRFRNDVEIEVKGGRNRNEY
jgi:hypothetical protein